MRRRVLTGVQFATFVAIALSMQWKNAAYTTGFGWHPDEPAHFVTGLMVYRYLTTAIGSNPMVFAERFYAHYPAVAFGHWPPLFYVMQAVWGVFAFGLTRTSALVLLAVLTAVTSMIVCAVVARRFGHGLGMLFGAIFAMLPIVQEHTASIMAEVPLTLFTFLAALALASFAEKPGRLRMCYSAGWAVAAILTKGNAWALLPVPIISGLLSRAPLRVWLLKFFWIPAVAIGVCCVPFTLMTMRMVEDGFNQPSPSFSFFAQALPAFGTCHIVIIGLPLFLLASIGMFATVIRPIARGKRVEPLWATQIALVVCVLLFHAIVPTSLECRKIFMSIPSLLLFAAAGVHAVLGSQQAIAIAVTAASLFGAGAVLSPHVVGHANMGGVAERVLADPQLDRTALLVSSAEHDERAELSFVAEVADREHGSFHHAVIRAGKFMADSSWLGYGYRLVYHDPTQVRAAIRAIPVAAIVLYTDGTYINPHSQLLEETISLDKDEWTRATPGLKGPGDGRVKLFFASQRQSDVIRLPSLNLTRKLGRVVPARF